MTPLRQRLIDDLRLRNYSPRTIEAYVAGVAKFAKHFGRAPDQLGPDELRTFQLHLLATGTSWSQFNQIVCALRLCYTITLRRPGLVEFIAGHKNPRQSGRHRPGGHTKLIQVEIPVRISSRTVGWQ